VLPADIRLLLGLWIALIVGFYSASQAQQDLYVLPFIPAGAALVCGLLDGLLGGTLSPALRRWTIGGLGLMLGALTVLGIGSAWLIGGSGNPITLAGVRPAGIVVAIGSVGALVLLARRRPTASLAAAVASVTVVLWLLVIVAMPDFERYKPVPHLARAIEAADPPAVRVATYRYATPSLVFYLRRHVDELLDEQQLVGFFAQFPGGYCVMRAEDYPTAQRVLGVPTRVVADTPRFDIKLPDIVARVPLPRLVLVTRERPLVSVPRMP
jgi:4-amino-4-deoxy-L-arabinose transferase-like glycosyltransferase